jgi:hypothetical protein
MRARGMTAKLDRLPISEEIKVWDLSLLSPEDQDRANDLMDLIQGSTDIEAQGLKAAINEFENLVEGLPLLGDNDRRQGPKTKCRGASRTIGGGGRMPRSGGTMLLISWKRSRSSDLSNYANSMVTEVEVAAGSLQLTNGMLMTAKS